MAYNNAIPAANHLLSQSQAEIQENFAQIQTLVGVNHINFGAAGSGKHLYLQLPEHAAPATAVNEAGFYANVGATSTVTELFFRRENNGVSIAFTEGTNAASGWSRLPSGVIMKWFTGGINGGATANVNLNSVGPNYATLYNIQASVTGTAGDTNGLYIQSSTAALVVLYRANDAGARTYYVTTLGV